MQGVSEAIEHVVGAASSEPVGEQLDTGDPPLALVNQYIEWLGSRGFDDRFPRNRLCVARYMARRRIGTADKGLFIMGDTGTGKTMAMRLLVRCHQIVRAAELADMFKEDLYGYESRIAANGFSYNGSIAYPSLVVDDLGEEMTVNRYGQTGEALSDTISKRYEMYQRAAGDRPLTHFTTNLDTEEIEARYGKRAWSRLQGMCYTVSFIGADRRIAKLATAERATV